MSAKSAHDSGNSSRNGSIWNVIVTLGVLAFGVVAVLDMYHLWKSRGERASENIPFGKCAICHSVKPVKHGIGPSLYCVVGRRIGSLYGYRYSVAMLLKGRGNSGTHWNVEQLAGFIQDPHGTVPGTRMPFPGLQGEEVLLLIEYLKRKCEYDIVSEKHQLLLIRTNESQEFDGCAVGHTAPTRTECEETLKELTIGDLTRPADRPLRLCVPVGRLAC